jgi:hypothetical protein
VVLPLLALETPDVGAVVGMLALDQQLALALDLLVDLVVQVLGVPMGGPRPQDEQQDEAEARFHGAPVLAPGPSRLAL